MEFRENIVWTILFPALSGAVAWLATRWYERRKHEAEADGMVVSNQHSEIENHKQIAKEWREAAQQWKNLVDEYQKKLIENAKRIDELFEDNAKLRRELATLKGQFTKSQSRIKELENHK